MKKILMLGLCSLLLASCGEDDGNPGNDFDRTEMLQNFADNIIVPAYGDASLAATNLYAAVERFINDPTFTRFNELRGEYQSAYRTWQLVNLFEFGPADNTSLRANLNTFPVNTTNVDALIDAGSYDLDAIANISSKGFPAIDYLLYGIAATDPEILALYSTDPDASDYQNFLAAVASDILARTLAVEEAWVDGYAADFKSSTGNTIGSSIGLFLNAYIFHYERPFRTLKLGLPAGVFSLEGDVFPEEAEAYYSDYSLALLHANFEQLRRVFDGRDANGVDGIGIDDYLDGVGAGTLRSTIQDQFAAIDAALDDLTDPLTDQLETDRQTVIDVYGKIQVMVALLKADMASALSLQITYTDNDGD